MIRMDYLPCAFFPLLMPLFNLLVSYFEYRKNWGCFISILL